MHLSLRELSACKRLLQTYTSSSKVSVMSSIFQMLVCTPSHEKILGVQLCGSPETNVFPQVNWDVPLEVEDRWSKSVAGTCRRHPSQVLESCFVSRCQRCPRQSLARSCNPSGSQSRRSRLLLCWRLEEDTSLSASCGALSTVPELIESL